MGGLQLENEMHCSKICKISAPFLQVVGNLTRICDIDLTWPGKAHDARVYHCSEFKKWVDRQGTFKVVADTAYPLGRNLMKPFTENEAQRDPRKKLFNKRLSSARTVLTENLFGR